MVAEWFWCPKAKFYSKFNITLLIPGIISGPSASPKSPCKRTWWGSITFLYIASGETIPMCYYRGNTLWQGVLELHFYFRLVSNLCFQEDSLQVIVSAYCWHLTLRCLLPSVLNIWRTMCGEVIAHILLDWNRMV